MNPILRIWNSLSTTRRIWLLAVPLVVGASILGLVRWKHESDFRVLYTGLSPEDGLAVTQRMREAGIEYRLEEAGAGILVPSARLAEARLSLAGAGLPRTGRPGYELLEKLSPGVSDTIETATLHRALEGEIEKTVATLSEVDRARVHLTFPKESVFLDSRQAAKATVVLGLKRGTRISPENVSAIAYLVASAVDGLAPESVAVIDEAGRLLSRPRATGDTEGRAAEANLDFRQQMETNLLARINGALEPLVGAGKFRAGISVDCDFTSTEQSEESYDAARSALLTVQTMEESTAGAAAGGTPGTASNLPQPPPRATAGSSGVTRRTENSSYQPGRTVRRTLSPKGAIRRISTAVVLDQMVRWDGTGLKAKKTFVAPSPEVIRAVHDVVAGITGFNEVRGDQITVETLPFESTLSMEPPGQALPGSRRQPGVDLKQPVAVGAGVVILLLTLAVGFLVLRRPVSRELNSAQDVAAVPLTPGAEQAIRAAESANQRLERQMADNQAVQLQLEEEALSRIRLPANTGKAEVLVRHIRESVQKDPGAAANVLRTWVSDVDSRRPG